MQFGDFIGRFGLEKKKILEVGCGAGEYLSIMAGFDAKCYGIEGGRENVKKCRDAGLDVTLNTDDPGVSKITLSEEYRFACENQGLSLPALRERIIAAAQAAFLTDREKKGLVESLDQELS